MTSTKSLPVDNTDRPAAVRERRKSVLFCPNCGYESLLTDGWHTEPHSETLRCPVCQTVVSDR